MIEPRRLACLWRAAGSGRRSNGVAGKAQRMDERRNGARVHFLAQTGDENLHRPRVVFVLTVPDALAEFRPGKKAARLLHQHLQDIELAGRKSNNFTGPGDATMLHIHLQIGHLQESAAVDVAPRRPIASIRAINSSIENGFDR